jgi:hypothetical protein
MMKSKLLFLILTIFLFNSIIFAQDWTDEKEDTKKTNFFIGANVGAFFANNNTASFYDGSNKNSPYGVQYILNNPNNKPVFDSYFNQTYSLEELPLNPTYKTALDLGLHAGLSIGKKISFFIDLNFATLNVNQLFTVLIDDPTNLSIEPNYEQLPIIGKEKRININLGTQLNYYNQGKTTLYWSVFGNFNSIELIRNYIIIDNREYEINHNTFQQPNIKPNGTGYGTGTGLGLKYKLSEELTTDLTYNFYYLKTSLSSLSNFGINHGISVRLIWN